jgi:hypothetical protein
MAYSSVFWRKHIFTLVIICSILFVLLTLVAMWFYPGGTYTDPKTTGYSFFHNFFSELGFVRSHAGQPKTLSAVLFAFAAMIGGGGLVLFFVAFPQFFVQTQSGTLLSILGSVFGVLSGICFIGVAFSPADLYLRIHRDFVLWAFRTSPIAAFIYAIAIFRDQLYPTRFAVVFLVFSALLFLYVLLLELGPGIHTSEGVTIQATGQKIIVYASILSIMFEAYYARRLGQNLVVGPPG